MEFLTEVDIGKGVKVWEDPTYACPEGAAIIVGKLADELQIAKDFPATAQPPADWSRRVQVAYRTLRRNGWIN